MSFASWDGALWWPVCEHEFCGRVAARTGGANNVRHPRQRRQCPRGQRVQRVFPTLSRADFYGPGDPRNHYERVAREVLVDGVDGGESGGPVAPRRVAAWTYLSLLDRAGMHAEAVPGGDWRRFMAERPHLTDAADDWRARLAAQ